MQTIIGSIVNMTRGLYDHLMSTRIFALIMNEIFIRAPKFRRQMAMSTF